MRTYAISTFTVLVMLAGTFALTTPAASAGAARATIPGSAPSWATPRRKVADANAGDLLKVRVYLRLRNHDQADTTARAVSDPKSKTFRQYLTPAQVKAQFAPTDASVASVEAWLASQGLGPDYVPANNAFVEAKGSVAQVEAAFGVHLGVYDYRGHHLRAPDGDLSIPGALAGTINGVIGVDQAQNLMTPDHIAADPPGAATGASGATAVPGVSQPDGRNKGGIPQPGGFRNAPPCSAFWGQLQDTKDPAYPGFPSPLSYAPCGYVPPQLRAAYGTQTLVDQGLTGASATVAIVDAFASPSIFKDAQKYSQLNDPQHVLQRSQFSQHNFPVDKSLAGPDECDAPGWFGEETLDVEAVHAMAPGAHIVYVGGSDCLDISLDKALNEVIADNLAQIVSNSYGDVGEDIPADEVAAFQDIAEEGVLQGIGVYFSSGDDGDEVANLGTPSPDFSASSPWVTAVGGTSTGIDQNGHRVVETAWETGKSTLNHKKYLPPSPGAFLYGSGGGTSRLFPQPFYQRGVVPDALATQNQSTPGAKGRVVPDISMDGDPNTGMLVGETQTFPEGVHYDQYRIGGTSLSSPLFAGFVALADDLLGIHHGFINPVMYAHIAGTPGIIDVVHQNNADVRVDYLNGIDATDGTTTSVRTFDFQGLAIHTTPGYDDTTGLGTPDGIQFLLRL
jgi:subtilase family serine protease